MGISLKLTYLKNTDDGVGGRSKMEAVEVT